MLLKHLLLVKSFRSCRQQQKKNISLISFSSSTEWCTCSSLDNVLVEVAPLKLSGKIPLPPVELAQYSRCLPSASFVWTVGEGCTLNGVACVAPPSEVFGVAWETFPEAKDEFPTLDARKENKGISEVAWDCSLTFQKKANCRDRSKWVEEQNDNPDFWEWFVLCTDLLGRFPSESALKGEWDLGQLGALGAHLQFTGMIHSSLLWREAEGAGSL